MTLANAILDRLLHHSHIIKIIGPSYKTKNELDYVQDNKSFYRYSKTLLTYWHMKKASD